MNLHLAPVVPAAFCPGVPLMPCPSRRFPVLFLLSALPAAAQTWVDFEARHTHPVALSPDGTRLFAVNSPDARLSVFDITSTSNPAPVLIAEIPVGMAPVSVRARTNDEVWVVNELSDSVSIVSISGRRTVTTLRAADEPADVVFAAGKAFVSCARSNAVRVFDAATRAELSTIPVNGLYPRALAVNAAGTRVYGAFLLSGNGTTVLPHAEAPDPPAPTNAALPPAPKTALIVPATDARIHYTVTNHDVVEIDAQTLTVTGYTGSVGTNLFDLAVHPVTGDLWVTNTEALNLTRFEPALRGHFVDNRLTRITLPAGGVSVFDLNAGLDYGTLPNPAALEVALAQPSALAMAADGSHTWVAAFGSDRVAKVLTDGTIAARVDLRPGGGSREMRGPRGLAWQQSTGRLYVLNKLSNSVSVVDPAAGTVIAEVSAGSYDPMPFGIKAGRGYIFDARLSGNGTMSCASCHLDGDRDGLAWDLGDPGGDMVTVPGKNISVHDFTDRDRVMHPMKGPMTTQTLRGLTDGTTPAAPFHWRGDRPSLLSFNGTFEKLMGGSQLGEGDINAMVDYLNTLRHHPNPWQKLNRTPPLLFNGGSPSSGRSLFTLHLHHCSVCHVLPASTGNNIDLMTEVGSTQPVKDPSLATVYQKMHFNPAPGGTSLSGFGMLHDGTGFALPTVHPYVLSELSTAQEFADVSSFVMTLDTGTPPAVGRDETVTAENRLSPGVLTVINELEGQAALQSCDLAVRGVLQGRARSFHYGFSGENFVYLSDLSTDPSYDSTALLEKLMPGDALMWMGVPAGMGRRFGGDRDEDGISDADGAVPVLDLHPTGGPLLLNWPRGAGDWFAESAGGPAGPWNTLTGSRTTLAGMWTLPYFSPPAGKAFFRLRRTW
jgi:YVTN family beta-propeller protein